MRSHEERFAETKRRIAARQRKEQRRRGTIAMFSATAACLVLIVGVSFAMPGVVAGIRPGDYAGYETAASMYGGGAALGYIVIGLLSSYYKVVVIRVPLQGQNATIDKVLWIGLNLLPQDGFRKAPTMALCF